MMSRSSTDNQIVLEAMSCVNALEVATVILYFHLNIKNYPFMKVN